MAAKKRGLGSSKMSKKLKHEIQSKGGKASHKGAITGEENVDDYSEGYFSEIHMPSQKSKVPQDTTTRVGSVTEDSEMETDLTEEWDEDETI
jgi:hypothetical protein